MIALHLGDTVHHVALDVLGRVELWLLGEVADGEARGQAGLAGVAVVEAGHDLQQRRLARAVDAEHADLGARVERQRDVLQHCLVGRVVTGELVGRGGIRRHGAPRLGGARPARFAAPPPAPRGPAAGVRLGGPAGIGWLFCTLLIVVLVAPARKLRCRRAVVRPGDAGEDFGYAWWGQGWCVGWVWCGA